MKVIQVIMGEVGGRRRIKLVFHFDRELIGMVRALPGASWSKALKCWHVADTQGNMNRISDLFIDRSRFELIVNTGDSGKLEGFQASGTFFLAPLERQDFIWLEALEDWMRHRRYSKSTIRGYCEVVSTYLRFIKPNSAESEPEGELMRFTKDYILPRGLSISYQNQVINGLKIFYREVLHRKLSLEQVSRPRVEHRLPSVLGKDKIKRILEALRNSKHRAMLSTVYGCGLRCGEVLNLRPGDIDSERRLLTVRQGKQKKLFPWKLLNRGSIYPAVKVSAGLPVMVPTPYSHPAAREVECMCGCMYNQLPGNRIKGYPGSFMLLSGDFTE